MNRPGVISWSLLYGQPDMLNRYLLLYDELWVPGLKESSPDEKAIEEWDLDRQHLASIAYLEEQGFLKEPPIDVMSKATRRDEVTSALMNIYDTAWATATKTYPTAEQAALEIGAAEFNMDIALSRLVTYVMWRDKEEQAYPVVFPFGTIEGEENELTQKQEVLSIVLKRLPAPSEKLPLEDIVFFKRSPETKYKFDKFWHWTQKVVKGTTNRNELEEEIDWLLTDYSHQVKQFTKKIKYEWVEVLLAPIVGALDGKFPFGKMVEGLVSLRQKNISAHEEELKLPGSEIAYVSEASLVLSRQLANL